MPKPPLIGVTAANDPLTPKQYILRWDYVHGLAAVGGIPVILAPSAAAESPGYVDHFAGIVLSGGRDIDPEYYHQEPGPALTPTSAERDEFELELAGTALEREIPILGICRGMQVLNVVLGGDLFQHIPDVFSGIISHDDPARPRTELVHDVAIVPGSRLYRVFGGDRTVVNSFHHQAIDRLGDGLTATATAADGVIEAVEATGRSFVVGVQWHPESLWKRGGVYLGLLAALVDAAREKRPARRRLRKSRRRTVGAV